MESSALNILVLVAFGLLVIVSGGIGYLTLAEWRDRRRREQEARESRPARPSQRTATKVKKSR
ncbi:hypothetical protein K9N68_18220 [Kovacikia minuta CCNUW1]|uniref:hypothetical protein n=1 Tax=Kovacikia minuta TaxID=2931930 RepID=UPI001CCFF6A8|nr:hypothetical protein [Kovacikia minuta]UBF23706.1 hypothetical protein K9N68_18220 [Kovacikia minuta CCNUW1]